MKNKTVKFLTTFVYLKRVAVYLKLDLLVVSVDSFDGAIRAVLEFSYFNTSQMRLISGKHAVVIKQVPFSFDLNNGVVVSPTHYWI